MKRLRVKILTTNNLFVSGELKTTMPLDNYRPNISDILNNSRTFIELTNVEVYGNDQQLLAKMPLLCINKPTITYLFEEEFAQTATDALNSDTFTQSSWQEPKLATTAGYSRYGVQAPAKVVFPLN